VLGRPLTPGNSGALQWGEEYRALHVAVWTECRRVLKPGGIFVLNVKDHIRGGVLSATGTRSRCSCSASSAPAACTFPALVSVTAPTGICASTTSLSSNCEEHHERPCVARPIRRPPSGSEHALALCGPIGDCPSEALLTSLLTAAGGCHRMSSMIIILACMR
jgi:hypothetical protein